MKFKILFMVLIFAVSNYAATRAADTLGQQSSSYKQGYDEWRWEMVREFNEALQTDLDSIFSFTTGLNANALDIDTLKDIKEIALDESIGSNPNYSSLYNAIKTSVVTIGHPGETTTDYAFTSAGNTTEQSLGVDT